MEKTGMYFTTNTPAIALTDLEELHKMTTDYEIDMFRPILIGSNDFVVTFMKANSSEVRTMKCNFFKPDDHKTFDEAYAYVVGVDAKDLITVYDLDENKWKSFYQSRVINWEIIQ